MYRPGGTVKDVLLRIERNEYVLPAIQREFVWEPLQISRFFDSLMRGYPFGTFLFWKIDQANSAKYKFYGFVRNYHEKDRPHCPELPLQVNRPLTAVLDGQQRLTALNIGLRGSMAIKEPHKRRNNPGAYPEKFLYLNLQRTNVDDEQGSTFDFRFMESARAELEVLDTWFKVADIMTMTSGPAMLKWLTTTIRVRDEVQLNHAFETLDSLYKAVHLTPSINFYEEENQSIERVLTIFIRTNSGGTELSYSDLLLSIAIAQWSTLDARKEIHNLVDELNQVRNGFGITKDFVLKAGLMLTDIASVGFKVENFTHENMARLEKDWADIRRALVLTVQLAASFGLDYQTLRAVSALLPIAYYLFGKKAPENFLTHSQFSADRRRIKGWLFRSLLKASGIWGSGLDTLLTALRSTIREGGFTAFPEQALQETMAKRGKALLFGEEEIDDLADLPYSDRRTFLLLSLLYPFVDLSNQFHVDHVFPASRFTYAKLKKEGLVDSRIFQFIDASNRLANLQLLEGRINNEKRAQLPSDWLRQRFPSEEERRHYCLLHDLNDVSESIEQFDEFYAARRAKLRGKIDDVVNRTA